MKPLRYWQGIANKPVVQGDKCCPCGSGLPSYHAWIDGDHVGRACSTCFDRKKAKYTDLIDELSELSSSATSDCCGPIIFHK